MSEFNNLISMLNDKNDIILSQQAKIDELQARVDAIHDVIERAKKSRSGNYLINEIGNILKGNKDE